jgi:four helix bundle protein
VKTLFKGPANFELESLIRNMQDNKRNLIIDLTFDFALKIVRYVEELEKQKKYMIARQLLRCGTGIGANVREAQNAESKIDFIHKMKIAAKEADETEFWLALCMKSESHPDCEELVAICSSIIKVLSKIISSTKSKAKN